MIPQITTAKFTYAAAISSGAVAAATPIVAVVATEFHWDTIIVALITGMFGALNLYMLSRLHSMVDGQQSILNAISQEAQRRAAQLQGEAEGRAKGIVEEKTRADAAAPAAPAPPTVVGTADTVVVGEIEGVVTKPKTKK